MASSFLDDITSSPLSSVPSDFDRSSKSPEPQTQAKSSTSSKRKAPTTRAAPARASRRLKTEDSFERSLTSIKEDIILPKVAKSRQAARKQNAAARTGSERKSSPVELQNAGENEVQAKVDGDVDPQVTKPDVSEAVPASVASPQPPEEGAQLDSAPELDVIDDNDATKQPSLNSVHEAPEEILHAQQPHSPPVDAALERPVHDHQPPSPSVDKLPEESLPVQQSPSPAIHEASDQLVHAQQSDIESKKNPVIDVEEVDTHPTMPVATTSDTPASPTVTIAPIEASEGSNDTTEAEPVEKLSTSEVPDETLDQLTQEEPRTNTRPSKKRLQPTKLEDYEPPVKAVAASVKKKAQPIRGNWSVSHLLTNPKSKLATCNLNALLNHENAWSLLSREQQLKLIAMLPPFIRENFPEFPEDMPIPNIMRQVMQSNNSFQADIRLFQEDLAAGRYDPKWLEDAQEAMEKRAQGHFDDWKERNREEFWGQKQKVDWTTNSGESAQYALVDLVKAGLFEVGDIWCLKCGGQGVKVEKEAKICVIAADGALSFTYPPGEHKFSTPANGEDILIEGVRNPKALVDAILSEDGRLAGVRRGNAWRDFRCFRKAQDIGSPWDMRELYNVRQSP